LAKAETILNYIREIPGLILAQDTACSVLSSAWFFSVPPDRCLVHSYPIFRWCVVSFTDSVVRKAKRWVCPCSCHKGIQGEQRYSSTRS